MAMTARVGTPLSIASVAAPPRKEWGVRERVIPQTCRTRRSSALTRSTDIGFVAMDWTVLRHGKRKVACGTLANHLSKFDTAQNGPSDRATGRRSALPN
uniref:Transposase n=1 Tax=Plectus sambesii TaxID=2011161 RepID=A0A914X1E9_9BILA